MINLLLSLAAALVTFSAFFFSGLAHALGSVFPALVAGIVAYIWLARGTVKQLEALMAEVQKELAGRRIEKAIALLEASFPLARWQFLVASQLHGQIGSLLYIQKKFDEAEPHLKKSFVKIWPARAMLAAQHFRRKEWKEMEDVFDAAIRASRFKSLLYAGYAWSENKRGGRKKAIEVLQQAAARGKWDDRLKTLRTRPRNDKRPK